MPILTIVYKQTTVVTQDHGIMFCSFGQFWTLISRANVIWKKQWKEKQLGQLIANEFPRGHFMKVNTDFQLFVSFKLLNLLCQKNLGSQFGISLHFWKKDRTLKCRMVTGVSALCTL